MTLEIPQTACVNMVPVSVPVLPVLGKGASAASAGSGNGLHASVHACTAAVARTDSSGRRRGPTVRADGDG